LEEKRVGCIDMRIIEKWRIVNGKITKDLNQESASITYRMPILENLKA
jgi:hypothetical protein